jgi:hypothetical protein
MVADYHRDQQHGVPWTFQEVMPVYHIIRPVNLLGFWTKVTKCNELSEFPAKIFEVKCMFHFSVAFIIAYRPQGRVKKFLNFLLKAFW